MVTAAGIGRITQGGGSTRLTGTLDLQGGSLDLSTVGLSNFDLYNGTIDGDVVGSGTGTLSAGFNLSATSYYPILRDVVLDANLDISNAGYVRLQNGLSIQAGRTLTINGGTLYYDGTQSIGGSGTLAFGSATTSDLYRWSSTMDAITAPFLPMPRPKLPGIGRFRLRWPILSVHSQV